MNQQEKQNVNRIGIGCFPIRSLFSWCLKFLAPVCLFNSLFRLTSKKISKRWCYWLFVGGIHWLSVDSPHKGPVTQRAFPCHGYSDHFVPAPTQWETTLHCNIVSYWLGAYTKLSLWIYKICHSICDVLCHILYTNRISSTIHEYICVGLMYISVNIKYVMMTLLLTLPLFMLDIKLDCKYDGDPFTDMD